MLLYLYQIFIFLLGHLHFLLYFFSTFIENLFKKHPIFHNIWMWYKCFCSIQSKTGFKFIMQIMQIKQAIFRMATRFSWCYVISKDMSEVGDILAPVPWFPFILPDRQCSLNQHTNTCARHHEIERQKIRQRLINHSLR